MWKSGLRLQTLGMVHSPDGGCVVSSGVLNFFDKKVWLAKFLADENSRTPSLNAGFDKDLLPFEKRTR